MTNTSDIIKSIYDTLLQLRYPHIANAELKDVEETILSGENRVCLLIWLLTEKSPLIASQLGKLKDAALEDQLFEYYSQMGICNNKDSLLGKCSMTEQLSTLRLLLDFMRKVHVESCDSTNETEESLIDIVKTYIDNTGQPPPSFIVKPKLNYAEAKKYFEEIEKELSNDDSADINTDLAKNSNLEVDDKMSDVEDVMLDKEKEKFIEEFQNISSWSTPARNPYTTATADSICSDIKSICSDFCRLKKILQAKDEILNVNLTKELPKITTPLNTVIEDIVLHTEQLKNLNIINNSID